MEKIIKLSVDDFTSNWEYYLKKYSNGLVIAYHGTYEELKEINPENPIHFSASYRIANEHLIAMSDGDEGEFGYIYSTEIPIKDVVYTDNIDQLEKSNKILFVETEGGNFRVDNPKNIKIKNISSKEGHILWNDNTIKIIFKKNIDFEPNIKFGGAIYIKHFTKIVKTRMKFKLKYYVIHLQNESDLKEFGIEVKEGKSGTLTLTNSLQKDEIDWAGFVPIEEAKKRIAKYQLPVIERYERGNIMESGGQVKFSKNEYEKIKHLIKNGDIILYKAKGFTSRMIRMFGQTDFDHSAVIRIKGKKIENIELDTAGFSITPLKDEIKDTQFFVILRPKNTNDKKITNAIKQTIHQFKNKKFSYKKILKIALTELKLKKYKDINGINNDTPTAICTELVNYYLGLVGIKDFNEMQYILPEDFLASDRLINIKKDYGGEIDYEDFDDWIFNKKVLETKLKMFVKLLK